MSGSYDKFIVRFELSHHRNESVVCSCLARDGGGASLTPSLTMSRFIDQTDITATKLKQIIACFTNLNACSFIACLDHDVLSSLYQQIELV